MLNTQPVSNEEIQEADSCIKKYVSKYQAVQSRPFPPFSKTGGRLPLSFTGNHCAKYLKVYGELMSSIDNKTKELTSNKTIQRTAQHVCRRYSKLNKYFGKLHERVSHTQPVSNEEIQEADSCIKKYVSKFRQYNPDHFTPKLHMLEHHIIPWMKRYGFGMALFGEQGGESCHRQLKFYMNRMMFIPNNVKRLTAVMREHIVSTHPQTNLHIPRPKKRKSANEDC